MHGQTRERELVPGQDDPACWRFKAMASPCEIRLEQAQSHLARSDAFAKAMDEIHRIEAKFSRYRPDSLLSRINATAGLGTSATVDTETAALLQFAAQLHRDSAGLFDITSGVLRRAWNFQSGVLPSQAALQASLDLVGWQHVGWDGETVRLPRAGMELDFGGIGKEYAADRAASLLQSLGFNQGYVNLGGDIRVIGPRADGRSWQFGIQHPRQASALVARIEVMHGALATSGDYERFIDHDGRRYCHILDPRTGWPTQHWQSISVVAPACVAAGALATIAMLQGPKALDFLQAQGVEFLAIDRNGRSHLPDKLGDHR